MSVLCRYGAYYVYFRSDECAPREEIHIHISEGKPTKDADKFWLTESGYFVPDKHNSKLQRRTYKDIGKYIKSGIYRYIRGEMV